MIFNLIAKHMYKNACEIAKLHTPENEEEFE